MILLVTRMFDFLKFFFFSDIQEFYEITLLDDTKSIQQKTAETLQIANKWENSPPLAGLTHNNEVSRIFYFSPPFAAPSPSFSG